MNFIDLSHPITDSMPTYPTDPDVFIKKEKDIKVDRSMVHSFTMGTHTGTHLDSPAHMINNGKTLDSFSIDTFFGRVVKVDNKTLKNLNKITEKIDAFEDHIRKIIE